MQHWNRTLYPLAILIALVAVPMAQPVAAIAAEQASSPEATAGVQPLASSQSYLAGSRGFFEHIGASEAVQVIDKAPSLDVIGEYQSASPGSTSSAYNLDNMKTAITLMKKCNQLRAQNGLDPLKVDPQLVAQGLACTNYSTVVWGHSQQYGNMGENLAWGYPDPFTGWYDNEKVEWEKPENSEARVYYASLADNPNQMSYLRQKYPDLYLKVGHYLNIISPYYTHIGAGYIESNSQFRSTNTSQLSFARYQFSSKSYSVDEFEQLFNTYYNSVQKTAPYRVNISKSYFGHLEVSPERAQAGDTVTISVVPADGYHLASLTASPSAQISGTGNVRTFTMPSGNVTLAATFEKGSTETPVQKSYKIKVENWLGSNCIVNVPSSAVENQKVTFSVSGDTSDLGIVEVRRALYAGTPVALTNTGTNTWTFTMPAADVTIIVKYNPSGATAHNVIATAGEGGTLTVSPTKATAGTYISFTPTPNAGYGINKWTITDAQGKTIAVSSWDGKTGTFTMPDSDVRINVTFVKKNTGGSTGGDEKPTDPNKPTEPEKPTDPETPGENPGGSGNEDEQGNTGGQTSPLEQFTDLEPNGWYKTSLTWAISNGYMNGIGGTTRFEPNKAMTRAQMAAVLYNMAGSPSINTSIVNKFSDCTPSAWYAKAVAWAVREGIFSGYGPNATTFGPNNDITREQAAVVLWRYKGSPAGTGSIHGFPDGNDANTWSRSALSWAIGNGLITGYGNTGKLMPNATLTRAQGATILMRWSGAGK